MSRTKRALRGLLLSALASCFLLGCEHQPYNWCAIREINYSIDMAKIYDDPQLPSHPLALEEIIEIAMQRNLDLLVKQREIDIQEEIATRDRLRMLPSLTLSGEISGRDKPVLTTSQSVITGAISTGFTSHESRTNRWDVVGAWSVIDFGLAFYRSRQEKNRILTNALEYQRVRQNLLLDIVTEFWKTIVAKKAVDGAEVIIAKAKERQKDLDQQIANKVIPEIEGLRNEDRLLAVQIQLQSYRREYDSSRELLSALMGIPPGTKFEIAPVGELNITSININPTRELEEIALKTRPELYTQDVQEEIMADEARAAVIQMFPNATGFLDSNFDRDKFLVFHYWRTAGIRAAWNLLNIPNLGAVKRSAEYRELQARENRLALSVGILSQLHIAHIRLDDATEQYALVKSQNGIKTRMLESTRKEVAQGVSTGAYLFDYEVDALLADINTMKAYAEMQVSIEQLNNALGKPLYFRGHGIPLVMEYHVAKTPCGDCPWMPGDGCSYIDGEEVNERCEPIYQECERDEQSNKKDEQSKELCGPPAPPRDEQNKKKDEQAKELCGPPAPPGLVTYRKAPAGDHIWDNCRPHRWWHKRRSSQRRDCYWDIREERFNNAEDKFAVGQEPEHQDPSNRDELGR